MLLRPALMKEGEQVHIGEPRPLARIAPRVANRERVLADEAMLTGRIRREGGVGLAHEEDTLGERDDALGLEVQRLSGGHMPLGGR